MKRHGLILEMVIVVLLAACGGIASAQVVNRQGTAFAAVPVGTSTPVTILDVRRQRCSWIVNWAQAGDMVCAPIISGTTPIFTPDATHGFMFTAANRPWENQSRLGDPSIGWQCVSTSGTLTVYTEEDEHCLQRADTP